MNVINVPDVVLVFSGKRKSGKDFTTDVLLERLGTDLCIILRLSGPLKRQYAKENNLDFNKLLDATSYKEEHRANMIKWGEEQRRKDPAYFCRLAVEDASPNHKVWIISDARRRTDVVFFKENYSKQTLTVRVTAEDSIRLERGFVHSKGVDDAESECGLDYGVSWDFIISNNGNTNELEPQLAKIIDHMQEMLSKK